MDTLVSLNNSEIFIISKSRIDSIVIFRILNSSNNSNILFCLIASFFEYKGIKSRSDTPFISILEPSDIEILRSCLIVP